MTMPSMLIPDRQDDKNAIGALLQIMLDAVVGTFAHENEALPARQYVTIGLPVVDCEQLTVSALQVYYGTPGSDPNAMQRCDGPRTCVVVIQLWRCDASPTGARGTTAPLPADLTKSALQTARDAWILMDSPSEINANTLGTGYMGEVHFLEPQGGYVGVQMNLTITVP